MKWLVLIFLVIGGYREPDARYARACVRLDAVSGGVVTCEKLEARFGTPKPPPAAATRASGAQDEKPGGKASDADTTVSISNGF